MSHVQCGEKSIPDRGKSPHEGLGRGACGSLGAAASEAECDEQVMGKKMRPSPIGPCAYCM